LRLRLTPYRPRRFVPADADLGDWSQIAPLFDRLENARADREQWLLDWSEVSAALDEESSRRYIAMTCQTDDAEAERAYLHFVENIEPQLKPRQFALCKLYAARPLPGDRYAVLNRDVATSVELFREENVPLETEEARLGQQYQKLTGSLTVQFRGEEKTLVQMSRYLEEPDRPLRQEAWELVARRRLQEREKFEDLFDSLLKLRVKIAGHAGFDSYLDFIFRQRRRFDYTPADCVAFHDAVEREVLPLLRELQADRRRRLGLPALRPWDLAVDPLQRPPLRPFENVSQLADGAQQIFTRLGFADEFRLMRDKHLLDLDNRKGKAPGGYQNNLNECRLPFIFMNAVGLQRDVETLLHEGGHAFHALATRDEELFAYRHNVPLEFAEVASMSLELLGNEHLEVFYDPTGARRARRAHLETIVTLLPWVATVDAFQHWIYTHPGHTREDRRREWLRLMDRFGGDVDWSGYEAERSYLWHRQLHIFLSPLYYIEYGIAQLGALQVWANARRDRAAALRAYRNALALGGSRPLPELFATAGCRLRFDAAAFRPLMQMLRDEWRDLV
jgi:oligoendopeptidase F